MGRVETTICIFLVLVVGWGCSTTGAASGSQTSREKPVATARGAGGPGDAIAKSVCDRSLQIFTNQATQFVAGSRAVPDACRSVRVDDTAEGLIATVYYPGDPVPWRFRVERGMGGAENEAYLPGLKEELESAPEKLKKQRASDSIIMLKSYIVDWVKSHGGGSFPDSLDVITELESVSSIPKDPWGGPYLYNTTGNRMVLISPGPDGRTGTSDDIDADSNCVGGAQPCIEVIHVH